MTSARTLHAPLHLTGDGAGPVHSAVYAQTLLLVYPRVKILFRSISCTLPL